MQKYIDFRRAEHAVADALSEATAELCTAARKNAHLLLDSHGLVTASFAVRRDPGYQSYTEYRAMVSAMRSGGFHRVRLTGGRGLVE